MDSLFSHAEPIPATGNSAVKTFSFHGTAPLAPSETFSALSEYIHLWWPLSLAQLAAVDPHLEFMAGQLVLDSSGRETVWAAVKQMVQSERLDLEFLPGTDHDGGLGLGAEVSLAFTLAAAPTGGTDVTISAEGQPADVARLLLCDTGDDPAQGSRVVDSLLKFLGGAAA